MAGVTVSMIHLFSGTEIVISYYIISRDHVQMYRTICVQRTLDGDACFDSFLPSTFPDSGDFLFYPFILFKSHKFRC